MRVIGVDPGIVVTGFGIIDKKGNRVLPPPKGNVRQTKPEPLRTTEEKNAYTILHKLVFNIKKIFAKVPGLRTKLGTYAAALFLLKDTFFLKVFLV